MLAHPAPFGSGSVEWAVAVSVPSSDIFDPPIRSLDKRRPQSRKIEIDVDRAAVRSLSIRAIRIFRVGSFLPADGSNHQLVGSGKFGASPSFFGSQVAFFSTE